MIFLPNHAVHFLEKPTLTHRTSAPVNLRLLADSAHSRNATTFGQQLRKNEWTQDQKLRELARLIKVTSDTIINWELRNIKPVTKNLTMVRKSLGLQQTKPQTQHLSMQRQRSRLSFYSWGGSYCSKQRRKFEKLHQADHLDRKVHNQFTAISFGTVNDSVRSDMLGAELSH